MLKGTIQEYKGLMMAYIFDNKELFILPFVALKAAIVFAQSPHDTCKNPSLERYTEFCLTQFLCFHNCRLITLYLGYLRVKGYFGDTFEGCLQLIPKIKAYNFQ